MTESSPKRQSSFIDAVDERLGIGGLRYPVPHHANGLMYSLGGVTLGAFILLVVSGIILAQFYQPGEATAHQSVANLITNVTLGRFLRAFHYWSAMAMVVLVALHLMRVFVTAAFKRPREATWLVGSVLAAFTGLFFVSGTILKWDQEAFEAFSHNREVGQLLGSLGFWFGAFGAPLLQRFFTLHVVVLPLLFGALTAAHLLLVKRHGTAPTPFYRGSEPEPTEPFTSHLRRLSVFTAVLAGIIAVLAAVAPPDLGPLPNSGIEVTKPPWPLLWLYGVENIVGVSGIIWASLVVVVVLAVVPFVDRSDELHPRRRMWIMAAAAVLAALPIALSLYAQLAPVEPHVEM